MDDQADPKLDAMAIAKAAEQCFLLSMSDDLTPDQQREMNATGKQLRTRRLAEPGHRPVQRWRSRCGIAAANAQLAEIIDLLDADRLKLAGYAKVMAKVDKLLGGLDALPRWRRGSSEVDAGWSSGRHGRQQRCCSP